MRRRKSKYLVRNSMICEVGCQEKKPGSEEIQEAAGKNEPGRKKKGDGKSSLAPVQASDRFPLGFGNGDRLRRTNLDAALTAQTLIHIDRLGLPVLDFKHAGRAGIHALAFAVTLALVYGYGIHRFFFTSSASV
jgi:hypothetical protein